MSSNDDDNLDKFRDSDDDIRPIETNTTVSGQALRDLLPKEIVLPPLPANTESESAPPKSDKTVTLADGTEVSKSAAEYMFNNEQNLLHKGDYIDLLMRVPSLRQIYVAAGWDQRVIEAERIDVDLSCFLLDKNGMTRVDSDFLFYNNSRGCDGAVKHMGDNRTAAAAGDNETIFLDLNGIPFDVFRIMFVLTVYDENRDGLHFGMARGIFLRLIDKEDGMEVFRMPLEEQDVENSNAVLGFCLVREGPKWYAEGLCQTSKNGLGNLARSYGILLLEEQGT